MSFDTQPIVYFGYHGGIDALQCLGDLILALLELDVPRESTASHMPETYVLGTQPSPR